MCVCAFAIFLHINKGAESSCVYIYIYTLITDVYVYIGGILRRREKEGLHAVGCKGKRHFRCQEVKVKKWRRKREGERGGERERIITFCTKTK